MLLVHYSAQLLYLQCTILDETLGSSFQSDPAYPSSQGSFLLCSIEASKLHYKLALLYCLSLDSTRACSNQEGAVSIIVDNWLVSPHFD